jgi:hypothetical protein
VVTKNKMRGKGGAGSGAREAAIASWSAEADALGKLGAAMVRRRGGGGRLSRHIVDGTTRGKKMTRG